MFQIKVNWGSPTLTGDAADQLAPFAETGQAEAVAVAGAGVVVGLAAAAARLLAPGDQSSGSIGVELELSDRWRVEGQLGSRGSGAGGIGSGVFKPAGERLPFGDAIGRAGQPRVEGLRAVAAEAKIPEARRKSSDRVQRHRAGPAPSGFGSPPLPLQGRTRNVRRAPPESPVDRAIGTRTLRAALATRIREGPADITTLDL